VRIDRPEPADDSDDPDRTSRARPSPDTPDATGKDPGRALSDGGLSRSSAVLPDAAWQVKRAEAYCATVDAVYRRYDIDHGQTRVEKSEHKAVPPATRRIESDAADRHREDPRDHQNGKPRLAGVADDAVLVRSEGSPHCPVSELKGDEPATAERLMKDPEFTGKSLRGFKGTDNPDFIDDYRRTYDAVGGPTAWASPRLDMTRMINQIQRHIYDKDGIDFTVVDLTGASSTQAGEVFENLDRWASDPAMHPKSKIIILGDDY
jgi:hypothetical protein